MSPWQKKLDDWCYENLDCNLVSLRSADAVTADMAALLEKAFKVLDLAERAAVCHSPLVDGRCERCPGCKLRQALEELP